MRLWFLCKSCYLLLPDWVVDRLCPHIQHLQTPFSREALMPGWGGRWAQLIGIAPFCPPIFEVQYFCFFRTHTIYKLLFRSYPTFIFVIYNEVFPQPSWAEWCSSSNAEGISVFFWKGRIVNIIGFWNHMVSVPLTWGSFARICYF